MFCDTEKALEEYLTMTDQIIASNVNIKGNAQKLETPETEVKTMDSEFNIDVFFADMVRMVSQKGSSNPKSFLKSLEQGMLKVVAKLRSDASCINIINAGRMNHGKSSLLNSLMDSDIFKVNDIRETVTNRRELFRDNIYLTDTPGLEAAGEDDEEAFNIYATANFIFFVHTLRIGELHAEEISYLKRLKALFPGDYLSSHLGIVLTFTESYQPDEIAVIREKIVNSLRSELGINNARIFEVSNSRYKKSREEGNEKKKDVFLKGSGILEIRDFIVDNAPLWQSENLALKQGILKSCKEKCVALTEPLKSSLNERCRVFKEVSDHANSFAEKFKERHAFLKSETSRLDRLKSKLSKATDSWNYDRSRY